MPWPYGKRELFDTLGFLVRFLRKIEKNRTESSLEIERYRGGLRNERTSYALVGRAWQLMSDWPISVEKCVRSNQFVFNGLSCRVLPKALSQFRLLSRQKFNPESVYAKIQELIQKGEVPTTRELAETSGNSYFTISSNKRLRRLLWRASCQRTKRRKTETVKSVLASLRAEGKVPTFVMVKRLGGQDAHFLPYLKKLVVDSQREYIDGLGRLADERFRKSQEVVATMTAGQRVTYAHLARELRMSRQALKKDSQIREMVEKANERSNPFWVVNKRQAARAQTRLVRRAISELVSEGRRPTPNALHERLHVAAWTLTRRKYLRNLIVQATRDCRLAEEKRDSELTEKLRTLMESRQATTRITYTELAKSLGTTPYFLKRNRDSFELIQTAKKHSLRRKAANLRHKSGESRYVYKPVELEELERRLQEIVDKTPVSFPTEINHLSEAIGVMWITMKKNPRLSVIIQKARERSGKYYSQFGCPNELLRSVGPSHHTVLVKRRGWDKYRLVSKADFKCTTCGKGYSVEIRSVPTQLQFAMAESASTPKAAEAAGIQVEGENKWIALIQNACLPEVKTLI